MPDARRLEAVPLSREAFAPFGEVPGDPAGPGRAINRGTALRYDHAAAPESTRPSARPNAALFRCAARPLPLRADALERHPHSTQLFASLRGGRWLVIVAPSLPDGSPDEDGLRAFACGPGEAVNLARGTWHHPVVALDGPAELLVLVWEDGGSGDCEERALSRPVEVQTGPA